MSDNRRRLIIATLLITGAFLRLYQLDQYPLGVHQDELSNIYDGWSLATTGADRYGDFYPGVVRAFGERDYRPALYPWLAAATQSLTGFSIVAGRLPAAIFGIASLFLIYGFARKMAGETYGLLALLLATLSPLHIQFSRMAHEGGILVGFFMILALYLWQRSARNDFPLLTTALLGLALGLSTNIYQATRLTGALLTAAVAIDIIRHSRARLKPLAVLAVSAFIGALPQVIFLFTDTERFVGRAEVLGVNASNPLEYVATVLYNFALNLGPVYLFVPPLLRGITVARLIPAEMPFFYIGVVTLALLAVRNGSRERMYIYVAMVIALLPAAITTDNPATMRMSAAVVLTPLFTAAGIVFIGSRIRNEARRQRFYYPGVVGALLVTSFIVTYRYVRSEVWREMSYQELGVRMGRAIGRHADNYDAVIVDPRISQAYLYIAAFKPIPPHEFHRLPKRLISEGMDTYTRLGKYYFVRETNIDRTVASLRGRGRILFLTQKKFPDLTQVDSVSFQNGRIYFATY